MIYLAYAVGLLVVGCVVSHIFPGISHWWIWLCVLVVSLVFLGCLARIVGGFYLVSCPECGLMLAMASMIVVMLGRPVCGVWFWWFVSGWCLSLCFRGGAVRLLSSLVAF